MARSCNDPAGLNRGHGPLLQWTVWLNRGHGPLLQWTAWLNRGHGLLLQWTALSESRGHGNTAGAS